MSKGKTQEDIATRAHMLRQRIYTLEEKHASAYPDKRQELAEEIAALLAEYRELLPEIEAEAERRKEELKRLRADTERKRRDLLMLLGQLPEPTPVNLAGVPLGTAPPFERVYQYPVAQLVHYGEPTWRSPRIHTKGEAAAFRQMDDPEYWSKDN